MKYLVTGHITISVHTEVEATSRGLAKRKALERNVQSLCHQCSSQDAREEWVTSGELDGDPVVIDIEASE